MTAAADADGASLAPQRRTRHRSARNVWCTPTPHTAARTVPRAATATNTAAVGRRETYGGPQRLAPLPTLGASARGVGLPLIPCDTYFWVVDISRYFISERTCIDICAVVMQSCVRLPVAHNAMRFIKGTQNMSRVTNSC